MEMPPIDVRFTYSPLNFKHKEIRILTIEPSSDPEGPIQVTIKHIDFSSHVDAFTRYQEEKNRLKARNPQATDWRSEALYTEFFKETLRFIALSYTWGPEFPAQDIVVTSPECRGWFSVRKNLYDFLKTRRDCVPAWFWIDQICIDQGKNDEKTHQVNQMAELYSVAAVEIWLSSEFEGSDELMDLIAREGIPTTQKPVPKLSVDKRGLSTYILSLHRFLCSPYWSRLWITQEIVLSKIVNIRVGSKILPWDTLFRGWIRVNTAWWSLDRTPKSKTEFDARLRILTINAARLGGYDDWEKIWHIIRGSKCSDNRDQVFGSMGMIHPSLRILADYSMRPQDILLMLLPRIVESAYAQRRLYSDSPLDSKSLNRSEQRSCMHLTRSWVEVLENDVYEINRRSVRHHLLTILLSLNPPKFGCSILEVWLLKYRLGYMIGEGYSLGLMLKRLKPKRSRRPLLVRFSSTKEQNDKPFTCPDSLFEASDKYSLSFAD